MQTWEREIRNFDRQLRRKEKQYKIHEITGLPIEEMDFSEPIPVDVFIQTNNKYGSLMFLEDDRDGEDNCDCLIL